MARVPRARLETLAIVAERGGSLPHTPEFSALAASLYVPNWRKAARPITDPTEYFFTGKVRERRSD